MNRRALLQELSRQFESDRSAGAEAGDDARTARLQRPDLGRKVRSEILDARERLAMAVETRRLKSVERLIVPQVLHEGAVAEDVAVVTGHRKDGDARSARLQGHDGALLPGKGLGPAQNFQDLGLVLLQLTTQLECQPVSRGVAPQPIPIGPDLNITAAQLSEQG
jgi:hypothetical protein